MAGTTDRAEGADDCPRWWLWLFGIVVLGAALRLYRLADLSIWYDEAWVLILSGPDYTFWDLFNVDKCLEPPLLPVLMRAWQTGAQSILTLDPLTRNSDFVIRLLPCLLGIASLPAIYAAAVAATGARRIALVATFLCAIAPLNVYYAQEVRSYTLYVLLGALAIFFHFRALDDGKLRYWVGLTLMLALAMYAHFFSVWLIAMLNLYCILTWKRYHHQVWRWSVAQIMAFLLSLPAYRTAFGMNDMASRVVAPWTHPPNVKTGLITVKSFFAGYSPQAVFYWPILFLVLLLFGLGLWSYRKEYHRLVFLVVMTLVPIGANIVVWTLRSFSFYEHRLFILTGVIVSFGVAAGLCALPRRWMRAGGMIALTTLMLPCLGDMYAHRLHPMQSHLLGMREKVPNRVSAGVVAANGGASSLVVHSGSYTATPWRHYLSGPQRLLALNQGSIDGFLAAAPVEALWRNANLLPLRADTLLKGVGDFWFVRAGWDNNHQGDAPGDRIQSAWLDSHYAPVGVWLPKPSVLAYSVLGEGPEALVRQRLLDYGSVSLTCSTGRDGLLVERLQGSLVQAVIALGESGPEALGLSMEMGLGAVTGAGMQVLATDGEMALSISTLSTGEGELTFPCLVDNAVGTTRDLALDWFQSDLVIDPLMWDKEDSEEDTWYEWYLHYDTPPHEPLDRPVYGCVLREPEQEAALSYKVDLPAGDYAVYAEVLLGQDAQHPERPSLRLESVDGDGAPTLLGTHHGAKTVRGERWWWVDLGILHSDGNPKMLRMVAFNEYGLEEAQAVLGRVRLVWANTPPAVERQTLALTPSETRRISVSATHMDSRNQRVDVSVFDKDSHEYRTIYFHVQTE